MSLTDGREQGRTLVDENHVMLRLAEIIKVDDVEGTILLFRRDMLPVAGESKLQHLPNRNGATCQVESRASDTRLDLRKYCLQERHELLDIKAQEGCRAVGAHPILRPIGFPRSMLAPPVGSMGTKTMREANVAWNTK